MLHTCSLEVRFRDIDKLGHVNNAVYLSYFEQARVHLFNDVFGSELNWKEKGLILARTEIDFLSPILLEENVFVDTTCTKIGEKSFTLSYRIYTMLDEERLEKAIGSSVLVCYDYINKATIKMPPKWRHLLEAMS